VRCPKRPEKKHQIHNKGGGISRNKHEYQKHLMKANGDSIAKRCTEIERSLKKNNSKKAFQIMKDLTSRLY
jgi:hypothetical protein